MTVNLETAGKASLLLLRILVAVQCAHLQDENDPDLMQVDEDETQMPMHRTNDSMLDYASAVYDAINGQPTFPNLCLNVLPTCVRNTQFEQFAFASARLMALRRLAAVLST